MATFNHLIVYEDRDAIRTSRWSLDGISTKDDSETDRGWLWFTSVKTGDDLVIIVYKDAAGASSVAVSDSVDVSGVSTTPAQLTLSAENTSGVSGTLFVHEWTKDVTLVPMMVSLCMDEDIELEYARSDEGHMGDVYSATDGYARFCSMSTWFILRLVSNLYAQELGGFGAQENERLTAPERLEPDWRGISQPDQLKDAATFYACWRAFRAADESAGEDSMLAYKADKCKEDYEDAKAAWNLTINTDPDTDEDADLSKSATLIRPTRT